ncbi:hydrogenase formation protein HypD [Pelosinus sp. UFO1]|uniref:hydrogenase formation protein HypD n=1 Tax=Pelosinus sp. UFO1 TaxID=484770 RepID=UPI0004D0D925|nr:hydrogenase formation protein HypD [Pelosinus sp. UFO1]AIF53575.1 hydrogenase expression/formation protein HypD [Pelosinus sp. UFO1]
MLQMNNEEIRKAADFFTHEIAKLAGDKSFRLMEVCGTHTVAIFKAGIRQLLPENVQLVSGPGCPVCVTPNEYLDTAIAFSRKSDVMIATFGDMLKVPGSSSTLAAEKAQGADIRIVYSSLEGLELAKRYPDKKVIFLAVGFETTAPTAAAAILMAEAEKVANFYVLSSHKLVPPALRALLSSGDSKVHGFLLPGHVSAMIGLTPYEFLSKEYNTPAVVAGFEPLDILQSVYMLLRQLDCGVAKVENQYRRIVPKEGNPAACEVLSTVYQAADAQWRGIGHLKNSGLVMREKYQKFDALLNIPVTVEETKEAKGCQCGSVLRGLMLPTSCPLFGKTCKPEHPVGSCMVSIEGTCAAWYKYGAGRWQV